MKYWIAILLVWNGILTVLLLQQQEHTFNMDVKLAEHMVKSHKRINAELQELKK